MSCKLGICTLSLGQSSAGHDLPTKLRAARAHGIQGVEIFDDDLLHLADSFPGGKDVQENGGLAAAVIRQLCQENDLTIICLQPFRHYEGILDNTQRARRFAELQHYMNLAQILGTDLLLIPSSFLPAEQLSNRDEDLVADLAAAADYGARQRPPIRIAYEALCWGTRIDVWERSWEMVTRVDRPNFGMCIDTFNLAGRVFADPSSTTGKTPHAERVITESLRRLTTYVDVRKVFLVQMGDAARLSEPLVPGHVLYNENQPTRMSWSRHCRLFYGEHHLGGYLPVKEIMTSVLVGLGYRGWSGITII
ncbi:related to dehydroshikimate dehydratase [Cephalotrichum gorgonifer]|uniref:Related to dehydroshikimate dehydratase n=1 Tax=Cephalotrichum gorgonifer TaxID=2041049 RepID=A0AAE8MT31_9PEZI|nr:related to dehydroshikimate dehydratase [Cephalotrichum gorgonifer]